MLQSAVLVRGLRSAIHLGMPPIPREIVLFIQQFQNIWIPRKEVDQVFAGSPNGTWSRQYIRELFARPCAGAGAGTVQLYDGNYIPDEQPFLFYKS